MAEPREYFGDTLGYWQQRRKLVEAWREEISKHRANPALTLDEQTALRLQVIKDAVRDYEEEIRSHLDQIKNVLDGAGVPNAGGLVSKIVEGYWQWADAALGSNHAETRKLKALHDAGKIT